MGNFDNLKNVLRDTKRLLFRIQFFRFSAFFIVYFAFKEQDLDLGYSLVEPWKRKVTSNSVPYFLNTSTRVTQWDHPLLQMHMKNIHEKTQEVYLAAYRLALKCRATQKFLLLWKMKAEDILHTCIDYANADIINVCDMEKMLKKLYGNVVRAARRPLVADLAMNWVIKMYDPKRTGSLRLDSLITALILLSSSTPAEKFYYLFKLAADDNMELDYNRLSVLLYDIVQVGLSTTTNRYILYLTFSTQNIYLTN